MKLSEIFFTLGTGELHNLYASKKDGTIRDEDKLKTLNSINLGLTDLYSRFMLKKKVAKIPYVETQDTYVIDDPELIEILSIGLNTHDLTGHTEHGYMLMDVNKFKIDNKHQKCILHNAPMLNELDVVYKARHPLLTEADIINDSEVYLPVDYLNALVYFIGSRMFTSIPNQLDGDLNEGVRYTQKYQQEIARLVNDGIDVDGLNEFKLFRVRGFV